MVEMEERELLTRSLRGYLEDLAESGLDELAFGEAVVPQQQRTVDAGRAAVPQQQVAADAGKPAVSQRPCADDAGRAAVSQQQCQGEELGEVTLAQPTVARPACKGEGNPLARLLFVMSGAGLATPAGGLLAKIMLAMGFASSEVFLLSFAEETPAGGGLRDELLSRIAEVGPEAVVALGEKAVRLLLQSDEPVEKLRGRFHDLAGIPLMPTLHPDAMLANEALKREVWSEMQQVMRRLAQPQ